jgi:hypothetical protein
MPQSALLFKERHEKRGNAKYDVIERWGGGYIFFFSFTKRRLNLNLGDPILKSNKQQNYQFCFIFFKHMNNDHQWNCKIVVVVDE